MRATADEFLEGDDDDDNDDGAVLGVAWRGTRS